MNFSHQHHLTLIFHPCITSASSRFCSRKSFLCCSLSCRVRFYPIALGENRMMLNPSESVPTSRLSTYFSQIKIQVLKISICIYIYKFVYAYVNVYIYYIYIYTHISIYAYTVVLRVEHSGTAAPWWQSHAQLVSSALFHVPVPFVLSPDSPTPFFALDSLDEHHDFQQQNSW